MKSFVNLAFPKHKEGFPGVSVVKNPPANAGDLGLLPGSGRPPRGGNAAHSGVLAWEIPQTEEPGGLQPMGSPRDGHDSATEQCELLA